jgi:hypothetical protein
MTPENPSQDKHFKSESKGRNGSLDAESVIGFADNPYSDKVAVLCHQIGQDFGLSEDRVSATKTVMARRSEEGFLGPAPRMV